MESWHSYTVPGYTVYICKHTLTYRLDIRSREIVVVLYVCATFELHPLIEEKQMNIAEINVLLLMHLKFHVYGIHFYTTCVCANFLLVKL